MNERMSQEDVEAMMDEAFRLLDAEEPEQALEIGRRLEAMRFSGGFEIQALAYQDMDEGGEAIRVLRNGTEQAPDVWMLWQLLGNCLSDDGRFDEALAAYDTGLALPDPDRVSLQSNRATVLWRCDRLDEANETAAQTLDDPAFADAEPELRAHVHGVCIGLLTDLGRHQEAIAHFDSLPDAEEWVEDPAGVAWLEAKYAIALWRAGRGEDADEALARAIRCDKTNSDAQWLKREMRRDGDSTGTIAYELLINGPWRADVFPEAGPAAGYVSYYHVVADDLEEALAFICEFEPAEIRDELEIEEVQAQDPCAEPKGVYWISGYSFYKAD